MGKCSSRDRKGWGVYCLLAAVALGCGDREPAVTEDPSVTRLPAQRDGLVWAWNGKLRGSGVSAGDQFGDPIALSGDTALVGSFMDSVNGTIGSAHAFIRTATTWSEQQRLVADDSVLNGSYGSALAVSGDTAFVGAPDSGCVYVVSRSDGQWHEEQKLTASDEATPPSRFGIQLSVSGDTLLVGALGAAYVFTRSGTAWVEQQKLTSGATGISTDTLNIPIALLDDTAIVGASADDDDEGGSGRSVYVFTRTGNVWAEQQRLSEPVQSFGSSVSLDGDTMLVGSSNWQGIFDNTQPGEAHVFTRTANVWSHQQKLTADDGELEDHFGDNVALSGDTAVVSATGDDDGGGSVYVFTRRGIVWSQAQKLENQGAQFFGRSLALSDDTLLVGTVDANSEGSEIGGVDVFSLAPFVPAGSAGDGGAGGRSDSADGGSSDGGAGGTGTKSDGGTSSTAAPSKAARRSSDHDGGCQVVPGGATGWPLVALSGAVLLLSRRVFGARLSVARGRCARQNTI